jgi:hypothetical protein
MPSITLMMSTMRALVDAFHGLHHLAHHFAALAGDVRGRGGQLVGLAGVVGVLLDGGGQFFHGRGGLFQGAGLLFGARGQVQVAGGDLLRGRGDGVGAMRTSLTILCRLSFMARRECISMPVSSLLSERMSTVRSPCATRSATLTASLSGRDTARATASASRRRSPRWRQQADDPGTRSIEDIGGSLVRARAAGVVDLDDLVHAFQHAAEGLVGVALEDRALLLLALTGNLGELLVDLQVAKLLENFS